MKLNNLLILSSIFLLSLANSVTQSFEECKKLKEIYQDLNLNCEEIKKTNNLRPNISKNILNKFDSYMQNFNEMYNNYMNNEEYKEFINILSKSIRDIKKDPKSNYRFMQKKIEENNTNLKNPSHIDLNLLFDEKARQNINKNFVNTIKSQKLAEEVKKEYKVYKDSNQPKIYENISKFYSDSLEEIKKDKEVKELAQKFSTSVHNFIEKHKDEYKQNGILTLEGQISTHPSEYIQKESQMLKDKFKEENYNIEDIDKLMKFDELFK